MKTIRETSHQVISGLLKDLEIKDGDRILEPSAGYGLLCDGIIKNHPNINLECVELNQECKTVLKNKGYNVVGSDFFLFKPDYQYDFIMAAPNFRDNVDCKHVMKMYDLLKDGGTLSSIMSPYWLIGDSELQKEFREWLKGKKHTIDVLPDNTFMEDGNTVPTIIIKIIKDETV